MRANNTPEPYGQVRRRDGRLDGGHGRRRGTRRRGERTGGPARLGRHCLAPPGRTGTASTATDLQGGTGRECLTAHAGAFPDRVVHGVGDAAYHGTALLAAGVTWTTRLPANAALFGPPQARTGKRGRPALKGRKLGRPAALAAAATWTRTEVYRYGQTETVD